MKKKFKLVMAPWREAYDREDYVSAVMFEDEGEYYLWQLETDKDGYYHTGRSMRRGGNLCEDLGKSVSLNELYPDDDPAIIMAALEKEKSK